MIYLGCSGWSYPDWVGPFYPSRNTDKLDYYAGIFNTVEINTTFYRVPEAKMVTGWMKRVSNRNFKFSVKFPREVTHKEMMSDARKAASDALKFEETHLLPMLEAGRLAAVLIQLPPYFTIKNTHRLMETLETLSTKRIRYFVEPRHGTLYGNDRFQADVVDAGAEVVDIDGPERAFDGIHSRSNTFYARFHGRNYELWDKKTDNPSDRYDYEYTPHELRPIAEIIRENLKRFSDAFIYFNNHPGGKAPRNALSLSEMLGLGAHDPQQRLI